MQILDFFLCDTIGYLKVMSLIKTLLNIIRFVIPIILVVLIITDLFKNVLNPNNKESVNKIKSRIIAAIIIFLVPTLVSLVVYLIQVILDDNSSGEYKISSCYTNATSVCIEKVEKYLDCSDITNSESKKKCLTYRGCNDYKLTNSCSLTTKLNEGNCSTYNKDSNYNIYRR